MGDFMIQNRASIWLCFVVGILAATMMTPHFGSLITIAIIGAVLAALRWCAHMEGRAEAYKEGRKP